MPERGSSALRLSCACKYLGGERGARQPMAVQRRRDRGGLTGAAANGSAGTGRRYQPMAVTGRTGRGGLTGATANDSARLWQRREGGPGRMDRRGGKRRRRGAAANGSGEKG